MPGKGHPLPTQHIYTGAQGTQDGVEGNLLGILKTKGRRASQGVAGDEAIAITWHRVRGGGDGLKKKLGNLE